MSPMWAPMVACLWGRPSWERASSLLSISHLQDTGPPAGNGAVEDTSALGHSSDPYSPTPAQK